MIPSSLVQSASAPPPTKVGPYEILALLGTGGMASVYLARARKLAGFERLVALKVLHPHLRGDPQLVATMTAEARLASRLRHPNVIGVIDVGESEDGLYLVMDYVEGESLAGLTKVANKRGTPIPDAIGLAILDGALAGLGAAHDLADPDGTKLGLVHRDFTPHNVLVGVDGSVRLGDFGIAKIAAPGEEKTKTGIVKGKTGYLAPEQARALPLDARCDVWAAGVVTWELLAHKRLFVANDEVSALLKIVHDPIPHLSKARPDLGRDVCHAVHRALERDLGLRVATARELRAALLEAFDRAGIRPASADELGAWVSDLAGDRIAERQAEIALPRSESKSETKATVVEPAIASAREVKQDTGATLSVATSSKARASKQSRPYVFAVLGIVVGLGASAFYFTRTQVPASTPAALPAAPSATTPTTANASMVATATPEVTPASTDSAPAVPSSTAPKAGIARLPNPPTPPVAHPPPSAPAKTPPPSGPARLTPSPFGQ